MNISQAIIHNYGGNGAVNFQVTVKDELIWNDPRPEPSSQDLETWFNDYLNAVEASRITKEAFDAKKQGDITALGNRSDMQAEAANANSVPALRALVLKLAEIIYSNEKGTIN